MTDADRIAQLCVSCKVKPVHHKLCHDCYLRNFSELEGQLAAAEARVKWLEEGKRIIELARDGVVFRQASIDEWLAAEPKEE